MILKIERESTTSHCVVNRLWKRLRKCRKAYCGMNDFYIKWCPRREYMTLKYCVIAQNVAEMYNM
jgi:hypothetical protein